MPSGVAALELSEAVDLPDGELLRVFLLRGEGLPGEVTLPLTGFFFGGAIYGRTGKCTRVRKFLKDRHMKQFRA